MESHWLKKSLIYLTVFFILAVSMLTWDVYRLLKTPMLHGQVPAIIDLENETSAQQFVQVLKEKGLVHSAKLFRLIIRAQGLSQHLKAGIYKIYPGESAQQFLHRVVDGDVIIKPFSIIEGANLTQVSEKLKHAPYLRYLPSDWKRIAGSYENAEGLLLANTYQYQAGSNSYALLKQANKKLMDYLTFSWQNRNRQLPYQSSYDMLIVASILEKEASLPEERKLISGVIINRLKNNMRLQMDPTVIYGLGSHYKGKLTRADLQIDSPYNTYKHHGLPPTPISMVGKNAIDAAAHPAFSDYYYFVARGDGTHQFSETYEQQRAAVAHYQQKDH